MTVTWQNIREEFPALHQAVRGHPFVCLDNAVARRKPHDVIEALSRFSKHQS